MTDKQIKTFKRNLDEYFEYLKTQLTNKKINKQMDYWGKSLFYRYKYWKNESNTSSKLSKEHAIVLEKILEELNITPEEYLKAIGKTDLLVELIKLNKKQEETTKENETKEKNMDIVKEQKQNLKILDTKLIDLYLSKRLQNCLRRAHRIFDYSTIFDLLYFEENIIKRTYNLGTKAETELKEKLLEYGIDYDNRKEIIKQYKEECFKDGIEKQLEKTIDQMIIEIFKKHPNVFSENEIIHLKKQKEQYNTILDFIENREQVDEKIKYILKYFSIDLDNEKECQDLLKKYLQNENNLIDERQKLNEIENSNKKLEKKIGEKKEVLKEIEKQLERRKSLEQQLEECNNEYKKLLEQYEKGIDHGTK